jgi:hypothetical protein
MATIPTLFAQEGWYTLSFIASRLNRSPRTIQHWARSGLFTRMGIKVIVIPAKGWAGRAITWLFIPIPGKYAMLRGISNIPLDNPSPIPLELGR